MEKLMKPAEYAKELGISRQAVYAKIKRGILTAKDVEGKLYIVVDNQTEQTSKKEVSTPPKSAEKPTTPKKSTTANSRTPQKDYEALLAAKDETIAVLKGTVKDLKKSNKQITTTLRGEIDLLKEAFHEMRTLYIQQIEHQKPATEAIDVVTEEPDAAEKEKRAWIGAKKLFKQLGIEKPKQQEKLLKRLKKAWKSGDERIRKVEGKFRFDADSRYDDLVK
jgi:valyl-tRNA synthetase